MRPMRFSPKTFAAVILSLGMVVATGWHWHAGRGEAEPAASLQQQGGESAGATSEPSAARAVRSESAASKNSAAVRAAADRHRAPGSRIALRAPVVQSAPDTEWRRSLAPRTPLPKEALLSPRGQVHQITVKLSDHLEARPGAAGELLVTADRAEDVAGLARVAEEWRLTFRPVQTATDDALRQLQDRAARRTGRAQPDLGGIVEAVLPEATPERVLAAAAALHALAEVEYAEIHSLDAPPPPPGDIAPPTPSLVVNQTYRGAATGVDVDYVWNTYGIRGIAGLKITDCEYQYRPTHEDLLGLVTFQSGIESMYTAFGDDHGTAVLGILGAGDNGYGMAGSAPWCELHFYPEFSTSEGGALQMRAATVAAAIAHSGEGDIVVLEMQETGAGGNYAPAEYSSAVWTAVTAGTDAGVIVVAAAGNGAQNLDSAAYQTYRSRGDSGAIIVGAANASRARLSYSTYGARVNLQGWGTGVATTGYGTLATYGGDADQKYASGFSGTSSATPIVASAVALLQAVAIDLFGQRLSPEEVREALVTSGRAQTGDVSKPIGPLPNLAAAIQAIGAPPPPPGLFDLASWSLDEFGTATPDLHGDPDANGLENLIEYVLGTDPKRRAARDSAWAPRVSVLPGPGANRTVRFAFQNPAGRTDVGWVVETTPSLQAGTWSPLVHGEGGVTVSRNGDEARVELVEASAPPQRFFRLRATVLVP
jgi:subtilisin family serine protease